MDTESENEWVIRTLKLFFFCDKSFQLIHKWCRFPDVLFCQDSKFFEKASPLLEDEADEFDQYLQAKAKDMDVENMSAEKMAQVECLVEHIGGIKMCDPHSEFVDSSVCQFMMFVLRDVFRYLGLTPEAKVPSQQYKICAFKHKLFAEAQQALAS